MFPVDSGWRLGPAVVHTRQARISEGALAHSAHPRASCLGPAGSGKSSWLVRVADALREAGREVVLADPGLDVASVPPTQVLLVDDLHLLAPEALEPIRQRAELPQACLAVAGRPFPTSEAMLAVLRRLDREAAPIVLGVVARSDVLAHLELSGRSFDTSCLTFLLQATGGLTWLVSYGLAVHDERDCAVDATHQALAHALVAQVARRMATLDERLIRSLELLASGERLLIGPLLDAAPDLVPHAHSEGLVLADGSLPPLVRTALAATQSQASPRPTGPGSAAALLMRRALACWRVGDLDGAAASAEALPREQDDAIAGASRDMVAAVWSARGMMATASGEYAARPSEAGPTPPRETIAHIGAALTHRLLPLEPGSTGRGVVSGSTNRIALELVGRGLRASLATPPVPDALSDLIRASELYTSGGSDLPIPELPAVIAVGVAIGWGHFATADQVVEAALAGGQGGSWARRRLLLWRAWLALLGERPQDARDALGAALDLPGKVSPRDDQMLSAVRVELARRHDTEAALQLAWESVKDRVRHTEVDLYGILPLTTLVTSAARLGDADTLDPQVGHALGLVEALGSPPVWSTQLQWACVQRGILLNRPDLVTPHARALVEAASGHKLAATLSSAGGVWMKVLAGTVDPAAVEAAARSLASAGLAWDGARLAGHASRRLDDRKASGRLLSVARELHRRDASTVPKGQPVAEPNAPEAVPAAGVALSQREAEVAMLVLEGKTYVEIGRTIFISAKTVEHHVAHMRRRLGATSRSDLMARLRVAVDPSATLPAPRSPTPIPPHRPSGSGADPRS